MGGGSWNLLNSDVENTWARSAFMVLDPAGGIGKTADFLMPDKNILKETDVEEESDDNQEIIDDAVKTNKTRSALLMTEGQELGQELQAGEVGTRDTFFGN